MKPGQHRLQFQLIKPGKAEHGKDYLYTEEFLDAIDENLRKRMGK